MKIRSFTVLALVSAAVALAQENQPPKCSVSGSVEDSVSHKPLEAFKVLLSPGNKLVVNDARGNFEFKDVSPGTYQLSAWSQQVMSQKKVLSVTCGQDLSGIRLSVDPVGTIVGKVLDENGEPVAKAGVDLIARDYYRGKLRYVLNSSAEANDRGDYLLNHVRPGYGYLVYAHSKASGHLEAISNVPANPKLRKKVFDLEYLGGADRPEVHKC